MAVTATPIYPQTIVTGVGVINNASGTTAQTIVTPGTNGSKIEAIFVTNTDTATYTVTLNVVVSSTTYVLGTFSVPASTGSSTSAPTLNALLLINPTLGILPRDANGNTFLYLASGATITAAVSSTVSSGKQLSFVTMQENF